LDLRIEDDKPKVLQGEIARDPAAPVDNTEGQLQFWRDCRATLETLYSRIKRLRIVSQETTDRIRRHGTGELIERVRPDSTASDSTDIEHTDSLLSTLQTQFNNIRKKFQDLEGLVAAAQFGPGGPKDRDYSEAWVENAVHQYEKVEFEKTAVRMGFEPNSLPMEPVLPAEDTDELAAMTDLVLEETARVGVAGEYKGKEISPGEGMPFPLNLAGRYAGEVGGLDQHQKGMRIWMLAQTVEKMGLPFEDPGLKKPETAEEGDAGNVEETQEEYAEMVPTEGTEMEEAETEEEPFVIPPGPRLPFRYTAFAEKLRKSMRETDRDLSSLEDSYDAFLKRHSPPLKPAQNPTLEAST
jgi:hypothetical protein